MQLHKAERVSQIYTRRDSGSSRHCQHEYHEEKQEHQGEQKRRRQEEEECYQRFSRSGKTQEDEYSWNVEIVHFLQKGVLMRYTPDFDRNSHRQIRCRYGQYWRSIGENTSIPVFCLNTPYWSGIGSILATSIGSILIFPIFFLTFTLLSNLINYKSNQIYSCGYNYQGYVNEENLSSIQPPKVAHSKKGPSAAHRDRYDCEVEPYCRGSRT
jgi:hypothetical protein